MLAKIGIQLFPHLYRCGHIEAAGIDTHDKCLFVDFRIFIDAATLKLIAQFLP